MTKLGCFSTTTTTTACLRNTELSNSEENIMKNCVTGAGSCPRRRSGPVRSPGEQRLSSACRPVVHALLCDCQNHRSRCGRDRASRNAHLIAASRARSRCCQEKKREGRERAARGEERMTVKAQFHADCIPVRRSAECLLEQQINKLTASASGQFTVTGCICKDAEM